MSYTTYTTEAIICGGRDRNTFDRSLLLFTREGGMLYAEARAARREHSKQRYALQDFTRVRVSLIRGKSGWRIGSIEALENFYTSADSREARGSVVRLVKMLRRFARGEEAITPVYDYMLGAFRVLSAEVEERAILEVVAQVHLLSFLGYVATENLPASLRVLDLTACVSVVNVDQLPLLEQHLAASIEHSHL